LQRLKAKVERVLGWSEIPLMLLGFVYLALYAIQVIAEPGEEADFFLELGSIGIYLVFGVDLLARLFVAGKKVFKPAGAVEFIKLNWLAILALTLPALRSLRVLRVLLVLRGIAPFFTSRANKVGMVIGVTTPLVLFTSAVSVLEAERYVEGANITTFGDAVWWAIASVSTVGYGDRFPVSDSGRMIATLLLIVGIGLFASLTSLLASWVMSQKDQEK
jgi:voltage-gated potassium channel